ncbi:ISAs1 family transposase [Streptacidiphilus albus]|uniref:ISAs1 family transposase n=1 Tax=Streptacidiphilus albus TaxID=105425 RepID=UPI000AEBE9F8|nr:ISAs1 family transposase [Streptacidiphilus albus]
MCRQSATVCLVKSPALAGVAALPLVERLRVLPDPRRRRGVRHPFVAVLLVAASAVLAGARSYAAIGQWSTSAPQHTLARLGARTVGALSIRVPPSSATIRRVIGHVCPGGLADLTGTDPAGAQSLAVDGKAARGSRHDQIPAAHLLAAMTDQGRTVTQLRVPDKTNEITCFAALLEPYDLTGVTVTADALHTQRAHARFLVEEKHAHYLLVIKANQPGLHRQVRSLPWKEVTARRYDRESGHGRKETRVTRTLTVTDLGLDFPHAVQAVRILRHRTDLRTGACTRQTVYAITDLTSHQASPQRLGQLARSQWTIENRLHFVRDTTFHEDASKIRTGHGPDNMATLRNLAINTLRDAGHHNIAAGLRHTSYEPFTRPLDLLGIA